MTPPIAITVPPPPGKNDMRNLSGRHPLDGARVSNLVPAIADQMGIDAETGVVIVSVRNGSTAARLGFRQGDIVQEVARQAIGNVNDLDRVLAQPQRVWLMAIRRGDQTLQLQVGW